MAIRVDGRDVTGIVMGGLFLSFVFISLAGIVASFFEEDKS